MRKMPFHLFLQGVGFLSVKVAFHFAANKTLDKWMALTAKATRFAGHGIGNVQ